MSVPERRAMVERPGETFVGSPAMCAARSLSRSGVYRPGPVTDADDLAMMSADRRIASEVAVLRLASNQCSNSTTAGHGINSQARAKADAAIMGIEALVPRPFGT